MLPGAPNTTLVALPLAPDTMDLIINELLFNPPADGYDYIEIYNRGRKTIDLQKIWLANRKTDGSLSNISPLSRIPWLFYPGQYDVFTENPEWVANNYLVKNPDNLLEITSLPSLPDDQGSLVLLDDQGRILDELDYDHQWHFPLVSNEEGIALERIEYNKATQDPSNWTSAASTAGYGTPTYRNSEFHGEERTGSMISLSPGLFSPDQDGLDDFCYIHFKLEEPGYVANITVFDASGRPVRYLVQNNMMGMEGDFRWDGLDDGHHALPMGIYILKTEIFTLRGKSRQFRNTVTLARRW